MKKWYGLLVFAGLSTVMPHAADARGSGVPVYRVGDDVPMRFRILRAMCLERRVRLENLDENDFVKDFSRQARKLGADAVVGLQSSTFDGTYEEEGGYLRVSGLVVDFVPSEQDTSYGRSRFVVAVLPVVISATDEIHDAEKIDAWVRDAARFWLERRGYYVQFAPVPHTFRFDDLAAMSDSALDAFCGRQTEFLLEATLESTGGMHVGLGGAGTSDLAGRVFSKSERRTVQAGTASGRKITFGGLLPTIPIPISLWSEISMPRKRLAIQNATRRLIESMMPDIRK